MKIKLTPTFRSLILLGIAVFTSIDSSAQAYRLDFQVKDLASQEVYLSYFYGKGQFYRDTSKVDESGKFFFEGKDTLAHGMYSIIAQNLKLFDFLVDAQEIQFSTDTMDIVKNMKIKDSKENEIFFEYMRFLDKQTEQVRLVRKQMKGLDKNSDKYVEYQDQVKRIDKDVKSFMAELHKKYPGSLTSNFIYALDYPTVPDPPKDENGVIDSTFGFRYFKAHFYDNFAWHDPRLLRTSTFQEKMDYYIDKLTLQDPDSVIETVDYLLSNTENNPETFKYTLSYLTGKYERSQVMGMDAVFVHLTKEYFIKRRQEWFSDDNLRKLVERANALDPLLIGKKAPNIIVKDTAMKEFIQLYDIEAKYTVVYIWSPDCGHCKEATPKLKKVYDRYRDKGVEVFAVGNEFENEEWIKFINKHQLDWINGSDGGDFTSNFRGLYDVHSTPQTYLLDKDKKILSKKMSVESLEKMLEYYYRNESESSESTN